MALIVILYRGHNEEGAVGRFHGLVTEVKASRVIVAYESTEPERGQGMQMHCAKK